ncbi:MAG: hypothetical protein J6T81_06265 [Bacteroidales bacterium]|nr:hypothetical protein [Bacteroidales bacterium]
MCSEDDRTKKKKDDKSDKNNQHCDMITAFYCAFIVLEAVLTAVIAINVKSIGDNSLVLAFIGILATFVVISNYAQMLEIRHRAEKEIDKIKYEVSEINKKLKLEESVNNRLTSLFFTDLNIIEQKVNNTKNEEERLFLLDKLFVYKDADDEQIKTKVSRILYGCILDSNISEKIAEKIYNISSIYMPMQNRDNMILVNMYLIGYGMLAVAIENNPKVAEYGYLIIKRYTIITNDIKTVRDDLSSLKEKTNDRAKTIIDKYLVGLQKLGLDNSYNIKNV